MGLANISENKRVNYVREIFFAITGSPGEVNELSEQVEVAKRREIKLNNEIEHNSFRRVIKKYAINGKRLGHNSFAPMVKMVPQVKVDMNLQLVIPTF